jgi:hypothetical protein
MNIEQEIINVGRRVAQMGATIANTRILSRNRRCRNSLHPLQKYVSFSSLCHPPVEYKFDFLRLRVMAIIWHLPYVGVQLSPLPLEISNQMQLLVTCLIHGTRFLNHIDSWTSSS